MAQYTARVHTIYGTRDIEIEANGEAEAKSKSSRYGKVLFVRKRNHWFVTGLSFSDRQIFLGRMAAMLASGVGTGDALRIIRDTFSGQIKRVAHGILLKIESGQDLATAISEIGQPDFPDNISALIKAGSAGGSSHEAIRESMAFEREMARIKKDASKGITGAVLSLVMAAGLNIGSVFYMMPQIMGHDMIKMMKNSVDVAWVTSLANWVGYIMIGLLLFFFALFMLSTVLKSIFPRQADGIILKIPVYKDFILAQKHYIALYGMSMLVKTGVRMENALELTAAATPKGSLQYELIRGRDAVRRGKPWAIELKSLHETDRAALSASLDREQVSRALVAIADQYRDLYADQIALFVPIMQSIAALFMTLSGAIMFGATILPMLQATKGAMM